VRSTRVKFQSYSVSLGVNVENYMSCIWVAKVINIYVEQVRTNREVPVAILNIHILTEMRKVTISPKGEESQLTSFFPLFQNMSHRSDDLAVPSVRWLGVHPTDIARLGMEAQPFSETDVNKLRKLLLRSYISSHAALRDQVPLFQKTRA
jgi:hypothetical protein